MTHISLARQARPTSDNKRLINTEPRREFPAGMVIRNFTNIAKSVSVTAKIQLIPQYYGYMSSARKQILMFEVTPYAASKNGVSGMPLRTNERCGVTNLMPTRKYQRLTVKCYFQTLTRLLLLCVRRRVPITVAARSKA
jgi:hypothetical protein